jgi:hypothetical protein
MSKNWKLLLGALAGALVLHLGWAADSRTATAQSTNASPVRTVSASDDPTRWISEQTNVPVGTSDRTFPPARLVDGPFVLTFAQSTFAGSVSLYTAPADAGCGASVDPVDLRLFTDASHKLLYRAPHVGTATRVNLDVPAGQTLCAVYELLATPGNTIMWQGFRPY